MSDKYIHGYKRLSSVLRSAHCGRVLQFWCPGCDAMHEASVAEFVWDKQVDKPTLDWWVQTNGIKLIKDENGRWTGQSERDTSGNVINLRCNVRVLKGMLTYGPTCTHELAGETVPMVEWNTEETIGLPGRPVITG